MVDTTLISTMLTIIFVGIGLVFAGGLAYIVNEGVQRRRDARPQAPSPTAEEPRRSEPQRAKQPA